MQTPQISIGEIVCAARQDYFDGLPTDGHFCYRHISVNSEFCLDMKPAATAFCGEQAATPSGAGAAANARIYRFEKVI